jgi:rod shape determining protein RodA
MPQMKLDWWLIFSVLGISLLGLVTMHSFSGQDTFFIRQSIWILVSFLVIIFLARVDFRFLRRTPVVMLAYGLSTLLLALTLVIGEVRNGARSWIDLGVMALQPADFAKITLIILLAKYFSRRHVEIAHIRHIIVSGLYAFIPFILISLQPDFGSSLVIGAIWFGTVLVSGISKKHLIAFFLISIIAFTALWNFGFKEYQKQRILTFIHPTANIRGSGYNAHQAMVAVGSGQLLGKGIGYGTQSRLKFLPEYQTDFIFAAFAEEWGYVGVLILLSLFSIIFIRFLLQTAITGETNFETLFVVGVGVYIAVHTCINIGMNLGLMPVTGIPVPFMSYGGSHLLSEAVAVGIVMGMRGYARVTSREKVRNEFIGPA